MIQWTNRTLGLGRFVLLGFCQGGPMAIASAVRYPEGVDRLLLYDSYTHGALVEGTDSELERQAEALAELIDIGWGRRATAFRKIFANLIIPGASKEQQRWLAELQRRTVSSKMAVRL